MAYSAGDRLVTITGDLPGGEVWANTWCVSGSGSNVEAVDAFRTLYISWGGICANEWVAARASVKDLSSGDSTEIPFTNVVGDDSTNNPLPTECALRVTLNSGAKHGGPFLCGMAADVLDANGSVNPTQLTGFIAALDTLANTDLPANDLNLCLHSPTTSSVGQVDTIRVGHIVDVIRRRRNRLTEGFTTVAVG